MTTVDSRRGEEGGVLPTFLAALLAVLVVTALLMQVGKGGALRSQAQNAADAAALGAVAEIRDRAVALAVSGTAPLGTGWLDTTPAAARRFASMNRATATKVEEAGIVGRTVKVTVKGNDRLGSTGVLKKLAERRADADAIATVDFPLCEYVGATATGGGVLTCKGVVVQGQDPRVVLKLFPIHLVSKVPPLIPQLFGLPGAGGPPPGNVSSEANRELGRQMAAARGWTGEQFACLDWVYQHESGWDERADNPTSSAYGIPQALPGSKMSSAGPDWETNPRTQIAWGLDYIAGRYGDPCGAKAFWVAHNWY